MPVASGDRFRSFRRGALTGCRSAIYRAAARARKRGDRRPSVRARRPDRDDRLVRIGAAFGGDGAETSSSFATAPPTRRRGSRSSSTGGRRWASTRAPAVAEKRDALREAVTAIVVSAASARADLGSLDFAGGKPWWLPPGRRDRLRLVLERASRRDAVRRARGLARARARVPRCQRARPPGRQLRLRALGLPHAAGVGGVATSRRARLGRRTGRHPGSGLGTELPRRRLGRRAGRRSAKGTPSSCGCRAAKGASGAAGTSGGGGLLAELVSLGLAPVLLGTSDPFEIDRAFIEWAERDA